MSNEDAIAMITEQIEKAARRIQQLEQELTWARNDKLYLERAIAEIRGDAVLPPAPSGPLSPCW